MKINFNTPKSCIVIEITTFLQTQQIDPIQNINSHHSFVSFQRKIGQNVYS